MTKITKIGLMSLLMSLFLCSCGTWQKTRNIFSPNECVPEIKLVKSIIDVPDALTQRQENPPVPSHGDNSVLLEWCLACAGNTRTLNDQLDAIRELNNPEVEE